MQIQNPELLNQIAEWRRKSTDGTITLDEMREAIKVLRGNRIGAIASATSAKAKTSKSKASAIPAKSADSLLSELDGL